MHAKYCYFVSVLKTIPIVETKTQNKDDTKMEPCSLTLHLHLIMFTPQLFRAHLVTIPLQIFVIYYPGYNFITFGNAVSHT